MNEKNDEIPQTTPNITTLHKIDTSFSSDSVEWCPHEPDRNVFVCANYQLQEGESNSSSRFGRILLFSIKPGEDLKLHQSIDTSAVLDQKWCHNKIKENSILGVVNAKKSLELYKLNSNDIKLEFITKYEIIDDDSETLLLSLDWSTGKYSSLEPNIIVSDSKGNIHIFTFNGVTIILSHSWHGHDYEAWICAFNYWDTNVVFSGGDDCKLFKYDVRTGYKPIATIKQHSAGVTCLHSNSQKEHLLASGSYDTNLFLWDIRNVKTSLSSIQMPGTLWRLKWDPRERSHLIAACMLDGVHIVDAQNNENLAIVANYYEHKNISYGADWSYLSEEDVRTFGKYTYLIGTCSFYDHQLCISGLHI